LSPSVSRVGFPDIRGSAPAVEDTLRVQAETPVLTVHHESTVLREMLGNQPHFIPQKVNEEKAISPNSIGSAGSSSLDATSSAETTDAVQGAITETIQALEEDGSGQVQEEDGSSVGTNNEDSRNKSTFPAVRNKYPISLSWLKEFKGN